MIKALSQLRDNRLWRHCVIVVGLVFLSFGTYFNALSGPFLWDDEVMVQSNGLIRSLSNVPLILTTSPFGAKLDASDFYRPIQTLTYAIDYSLWELDPFGYHLTNVLLHSLTVVLLYFLIARLGYNDFVASVVAGIFAVHPLNIEAVTYISGRGDVVYLFLCILALLLFTQLVPRRWWVIPLIWIIYAMALFTKENAVPLGVLAVILALYPVFFKSNVCQKIAAFGMCLSTLGYGSVRLYFIGELGNHTLSWIAEATPAQRFYTIPYIFVTYLRLIVAPYDLHMEYHFVESTLFSGHLLWLTLILVSAIVAIYRSKNRKAAIFWVMWFVIALGPVLQITPLASTVREHWVTMAQIGVWVWLISAFDLLVPNTVIKRTACWLLIIIFSVISISRNADWNDPLRLFKHDGALEPKSFLLKNNEGVVLFRGGDMVGAQAAFEASIKNTPGTIGYGTALNNLGVIYENQQRFDQSVSLYRQSILASQYELAYCNLARSYLTMGKYADAELAINEGLRHYPYNAMLKFSKVATLMAQHRLYDMEVAAQELLRMYPEYAQKLDILRRNGTF